MTDINRLHFCIYEQLRSEDYPLRFDIAVQKCANLNAALQAQAEQLVNLFLTIFVVLKPQPCPRRLWTWLYLLLIQIMTLTIWMHLVVIYLDIQLIHLTTIQAFFRNLIRLEFESRICCGIGRTNLASN